MAEPPPAPAFASSIPYEPTRINAAAVYCADGRVGDHVDEFLHQSLGLPRYDRLACPGGPAALAGRLLAFWEARGVPDQLRFMVRAHELRQVILIGHDGCAYYRERFGLAGEQGEAEQRLDLARAASAVQRIDEALEVAAFYARVQHGALAFERVLATAGIERRLRPQRPAAETPAPGGRTGGGRAPAVPGRGPGLRR
jgi:hypothetical protein